jgi:hypothetical protein
MQKKRELLSIFTKFVNFYLVNVYWMLSYVDKSSFIINFPHFQLLLGHGGITRVVAPHK